MPTQRCWIALQRSLASTNRRVLSYSLVRRCQDGRCMVLKPVLALLQNEMDGPRPSARHTRCGLKNASRIKQP